MAIRYRWIEKWREGGAPAEASYCDLAGWKTITDIRDHETLAALGLVPFRPAGERRRFSL